MNAKGTNTTPAQDKEEAKECLKAADRYIKDLLFEKAKEALDKAKKLDPTNIYIDAFRDRITYFEQQQKKEAAKKGQPQTEARQEKPEAPRGIDVQDETRRRIEEEKKRQIEEKKRVAEGEARKFQEDQTKATELKKKQEEQSGTEEETKRKSSEERRQLEEQIRHKALTKSSEKLQNEQRKIEELQRKLENEEQRQVDDGEKRLAEERRRLEGVERNAKEELNQFEETIRRKAGEEARRKVEGELRQRSEEDRRQGPDPDVQRRAEEQGRRRARMKKFEEFMTRAEELLTEKEFDAALTEISKALALDPTSEDAQRLFEEIDHAGIDESRRFEAQRAKESLDHQADQYKGTILLISSDPAVTTDLLKKLKNSGYAVILAPNPESALEKIEKIHPNVILSDVEFSQDNLSGIKFLQVLRLNSKFSFMPFIFLCDPQEISQLHSSELRQFEGFVQKPVDFNELTRVMNEKLKHFKDYIYSLMA